MWWFHKLDGSLYVVPFCRFDSTQQSINMSFFYNPFYTPYSPFYDFFDDVANAVDQLAQDPNVVAARRANQQASRPRQAVTQAPKPTAAAPPATQAVAATNDHQRAVAPPVERPQSLVSSFFNEDPFFGTDWVGNKIIPALNIHENDDSYSLRLSAPGALKDNLTIDFNKDTKELIIKGEIPASKLDEERGETLIHSEIPAGKFERRLKLPGTVDGEKITATFENGILTLQVPKLKNGEGDLQRIEISESAKFETE
ncbi:DEKNAAC102856 [Brettanomyces naardenensis]|uniref:DEKNAAC102856 n=1 Tax=Brettanomyces naardenensis TaxID=13370 RepID=A0A448YLW3_BRENA|nr:DEKNAAC102856 [Brettanomyces naardenensis]